MNREELLNFINTTAEIKGDEEFSNLVFNEYFLFLTSDFISNVNDIETFNYVTKHPKFDVSYVDMVNYINSFNSKIKNKISNSNLSFLNTPSLILDYIFNNARNDNNLKSALIEFIYSSFSEELESLFMYLVSYHKDKIDINYPTKYGFPLIWELFYLYFTVLKSNRNRSTFIIHTIYMIIKNQFPDLDINSTGNKNFDVFHYLFNMKSGTTLSSDIEDKDISVVIDFFISYPNFYFLNNTSKDKEPEKLFFNLLRENSGFYGQNRYKNCLSVLVNHIYLDVNYKIDNLSLNIFELLLERTYFDDKSPIGLLYQELVYIFMKKYKNKLSISSLILNGVYSNRYFTTEQKLKYKKIYDEIKSNTFKNLNTILNSIDDSNSLNEEEEELENVDYCADYYGTEGAREISHKFKNNDPNAIKVMARMMAKFINSDDSLIPIPSRNGVATNTLDLVNALAKLTGARVSNILKGKPRESIYYIKKRGEDVRSVDFGYKLMDKIPDNPVLIDGVYDTGTTLRNVLNIIPNARIVVFAKTIRNNIN